MKLVEINQENRQFFLGLDPFGFLDRAAVVPQFCLGVAEEGEESDTPCGLMICFLYTRSLVIRWLFVAPAFRGKGYGEALLSAAMDAAAIGEKQRIAAMMGQEYGRNLVCPGEKEYFRYQGFTTEISVGRDHTTLLILDVSEGEKGSSEGMDVFDELLRRLEEAEETGEDLSEEEALSENWNTEEILRRLQNPGILPERMPKEGDMVITVAELAVQEDLAIPEEDWEKLRERLVPLEDLTLPEMGTVLRRCLKRHPYQGDGRDLLKESPAWFDPKISICARSGRTPIGVCLLHRNEDGSFLVEYLCDVSQDVKLHNLLMVKGVAEALLKNCAPDTKVVIPPGAIDLENGLS